MVLKSQIPGVEFHIANFLKNNLLHLVAVLLVLVPTSLLRLVGADQPVLHNTNWLQGLLLTLIADLPGLLLAVLGIAVLLGLLRASLHLKLADLLGLEVAVLLLNWEGEDVGKLLTVPVHVSLADLHLDLPGDVIAALGGFPIAHNALRSIPIVLGALVPLAVELHGISAGDIVDHLFLHIAVRGLHVGALVVILGGHVYLVCGVTYPVLTSEAPLHLVCLLKCLVMNSFDQVTYQLVHVETDSLDIGFNNTGAVLEGLGCTGFLILGVASPLCVGLALVLEYHLLNHVAVGVLVDTVPPNISLSNIRMIILGRCRSWIQGR